MFRKLFNVSVISSMREIIDLNDIPSSLMINSTGQSGHPTHKHYDDLLKLWLKNEYHPVFFEIKKEEKNSFDILKLIPLSNAVEHSSPR